MLKITFIVFLPPSPLWSTHFSCRRHQFINFEVKIFILSSTLWRCMQHKTCSTYWLISSQRGVEKRKKILRFSTTQKFFFILVRSSLSQNYFSHEFIAYSAAAAAQRKVLDESSQWLNRLRSSSHLRRRHSHRHFDGMS